MKICWCLFVNLILFVHFIISKPFHPCNALDRTKSNLSGIAVIFADIEKFWLSNKDEQSSGFIEQFYSCYGGPGGLSVESIVFRLKSNSCELIQSPEIGNSFKKPKVIVSSDLAVTCNIGFVKNETTTKLNLNPKTTIFHVSNISHPARFTWKANRTIRFARLNFINASRQFLSYEKMEVFIENLALENQSKNSSENLEDIHQKYTYFSSIRPSPTEVWPSVVAVFLVIFFFFFCLGLCCCNLLLYTLVEEDYRRRNEERDWLEGNLRRMEFAEEAVPGQTPIAEDQMRLDADLNRSQQSLQSTQLSETISGTPHTRSTQADD